MADPEGPADDHSTTVIWNPSWGNGMLFFLAGIVMAQLGIAGEFSFDYRIQLGEKPGSPFYQMTVKNTHFQVSKRSLLQPHENFEVEGSLSSSQRDLLVKVLGKIPNRVGGVSPSLAGAVVLTWTVQGQSNSFQASSDQSVPALEDFFDFLEEFHRDTPDLASFRPLLAGGQRVRKNRSAPIAAKDATKREEMEVIERVPIDSRWNDRVASKVKKKLLNRRVHLPLTVETNGFEVTSTYLEQKSVKIPVDIDSTHLGVDLLTQVKRFCSEGKCRVWLAGQFAKPGGSPLSPGSKKEVFVVSQVVGPASLGDSEIRVLR